MSDAAIIKLVIAAAFAASSWHSAQWGGTDSSYTEAHGWKGFSFYGIGLALLVCV
jgi:hypothetical protein